MMIPSRSLILAVNKLLEPEKIAAVLQTAIPRFAPKANRMILPDLQMSPWQFLSVT